MGVCYENGLGIPESLTDAAKLAANHGPAIEQILNSFFRSGGNKCVYICSNVKWITTDPEMIF